MESNSNSNYFPKRAGKNQSGREIALATNYFPFSFLKNSSMCYFKYAIDFEPELPGDSVHLRRRIWRSAGEAIKEKLGHTIFNNTTCYSQKNLSDTFEIQTKAGEEDYKIQIKWANLVDTNSVEALSLYKKFFGQLVRRIKLVPMRRSYFDPNQAKKVEDLEVWPGFNSAINMFPNGVLLNMNIIYRVLRPETVLDMLTKLKSKCNNASDFTTEAKNSIKGCVVLTRYNNDKTYIIDDLDFTKTPTDSFSTKNGDKTFLQYYKEKYGRQIGEPNQPLLAHLDKKKNQTIYLIPEFCFLTGLTDEMRSNFNTMKQLSAITKGNANEKMRECVNVINMFLNKEDCKTDIENWGLTVSNRPVTLKGRKLDAGNILMHKSGEGRFNFSIDNTDDIDRKIQAEMYSQPPIRKWLVFSTNKDRDTTENFLQTLKKVQESFRYAMDAPQVIYVKSTQCRDWEETISTNVSPQVQAVILVLPGPKGKGYNYNELKRLLTVKYPIPSQEYILIDLAKGLRSVINKVLIQICAKVGGEPWAVDRIPFTDRPTMVVGIDVYNKGGKSIVGSCGTFNNTFTKYMSVVNVQAQGEDLSNLVSESVKTLANNFNTINKIPPRHIIILRDGVAPSQIKSAIKEVETIRSQLENIQMTYILLNKKTTLKVFAMNNNSFNNIPPGTLIDDVVIEEDKQDFFLVSQKTNQGLSQATHYNVIYDDCKLKADDVHSFIYKLCYLYYNWTGGIKIPAPCQYAKKLAFLVGDKLSSNKETVLPGDRFLNEIRSLYFL